MPNDLLDTLRRALAEFRIADDTAQKVEIRIREQLGGCRPYVPKATVEGKVQRLAAAVAAGVPLKTAFDTAGVPRRTGYRLLNRRWKVR